MNATARVIGLLRTLEDARIAWEPNAGGGGWGSMPSVYNEGSYQALETALTDIRDDESTRRLWWHASMRWRYGESVWMEVPVRKTTQGPLLIMPRHCELVAGGAVSGDRYAWVRAYRWSVGVDQDVALRGAQHLAWLMRHDRKGIHLPAVYLYRQLGLPLREERRRQAA